MLALRAGGDGSHQLIVALHPAELGPVNVHVRIVGDLMTIQLASTSETAHDTLRDALPQLRSELQSAGLSSASLSLDLTSGGSAGSGAFADPRQAAGDRTGRPGRCRRRPAACRATTPRQRRPDRHHILRAPVWTGGCEHLRTGEQMTQPVSSVATGVPVAPNPAIDDR